MGVRFHAPGFTSWTVANLTVSNSAVIFGEDGFALTVTGNLTVGANGLLGIGAISSTAQAALACGSLRVRDGGQLQVFGGRTNGTDIGLGASVDVEGALIVETGGRIYPFANEFTAGGGGSPRFRARTLTVGATGGIVANSLGYRYQNGLAPGLTAASGGGGGGGADGTVLLAARDLQVAAGAGISARGGNGRAGEAGGGGRIAFWQNVAPAQRAALLGGASAAPGLRELDAPYPAFLATPVVNGGTGYEAGLSGTVRYLDGTPVGTVIMLR